MSKLDGKEQNVLPREVAFDTVSDEPIHIDFVRIVKGSRIILEIPVNYKPRSKEEGKKITILDGLSCIISIIKFKFFR